MPTSIRKYELSQPRRVAETSLYLSTIKREKIVLLHNEFSFAAIFETTITRHGKSTKKCYVKKKSHVKSAV
jgi:hypothetical protein